MEINLKNVEDLIFFDKKAQAALPDFKDLFDQWHLGRMIPALNGIGNKSIFDLINSLESKHLESLERYFGEKIIFNKIETGIVKNHSINLSDNLCGFSEYKDFFAYRNKNEIFISFWR